MEYLDPEGREGEGDPRNGKRTPGRGAGSSPEELPEYLGRVRWGRDGKGNPTKPPWVWNQGRKVGAAQAQHTWVQREPRDR